MKSTSHIVFSSGRISRSLALVTCLLAARGARAANDYWAGIPGTSVDTNWTTAANWTSAVQTYYNEVEFLGVGANPNNVVTVNNVLNGTTGVSQMPIWELDYACTNLNYTTLISSGVTMNLNAGRGYLDAGADVLHTSSAAPANATETFTIQGPGAAITMAGNLTVAQGSVTPNDTHNVTLDLSGVDSFVDNGTGNYIYVAANGAPRANGILYLAKNNAITLGNGIQICNQSTYSNSMPVSVYLGINNTITLGASGNMTVGGTGTTAAGAFLKFNPAFLGGSTPPAATMGSAATGGRINNFYVCNVSGTAAVPAASLCDFSGGYVNILIGNLQLGLTASGAWGANGVLTFDNGIVDASSAYIGRQQNSAGGAASGTVNINSNSTYAASALLRVGGTLSLASVTGTLTAGTAGTVNINGGALSAATITAGLGTSAINSTLGSITLGGYAGTLAAPIGTLALTNSTLNLAVLNVPTNVVVGKLVTSGTNMITISAVPPEASYPQQIPLVKYLTSLGGAGYNFGLGALPPLCSGYLSNDTANASIDLVLSTGPLQDIWNGAVSGDWDSTTANWTGVGAVDYADGNFVQFPDGAVTGTVNLTTTVMPAGITVTNNSLLYTFSGGGAIAGSTGLVKTGSGALVIDNSGGNTFTGNITVSAGTLQVGTNDGNGNLPNVPLANAGVLAFDRQDNIIVPNAISGAGLVAVVGGGQVEFTGANTFTGPLLATNNSTVQLGSGSAAGAGTNGLIVANGSALDINGNSTYKPIVVSGTGANGNGAIFNSGGAVYDSSYGIATNVTLTGDTTFYMNNRWDMGAPNAGAVLSTGGHPYNLTLNASGYFEWKNLTLDTNLANINLVAGTWGLVGTTSFGNPNSNVVISSGASVDFYGGSKVVMNKQVDFQNGTINNNSGANIINGVVTVEPGYCSLNIANGTSLTFSNALTGSGTFYQNTGTGTSVLDGNSPNFTGQILLYGGQVTLNGIVDANVTAESGTTFGGSGTASNLVDVAGAFLPGGASSVGTFTAAGGLTLEGSSSVTMDLGKAVTVGGTNSDLVTVIGDLTVNNNSININPISGTLASGAYTLFTYTGNLNGSFGTASTVTSSRYGFVIDTSMPHQVRLIVTGVSDLLVWNNGGNNGQWDVQSSLNWSNLTTHVEDQFYTADTVVFDDSINLAKFPITSIVIPSGQLVVPNLLTNNSTANYTISGAGQISGAAQIIKLGSSTLTISNANNYTGGTTVSGGTLAARATSALGSGPGAITVTNGGTVDIGYGLGSQPLFVSGAGVGGNGALVNNSGSAVYDSGAGLAASVTLTGDTTFGGTTRWDLGDRGTTGTVLSTGGNPFNLTITGSAGLYLEWDNLALDTNLANITIQPNITLGMIGASTFGNPTNTLTISSNSSLVFYNDGSASPLLNKRVQILNDGTLQNGGGTTIDLGPVVLGVNASDVCDFNIGGTSLSVSNVISGPGTLFKLSSSSPMYLAATNTYTGGTIVSNGVLALTGNGSISTSSAITLVNAGIVDVSARVDQTLTLASGQTLQGAGTINGNLTVATGATVSPGGLNSIGTLTVTNAVMLSGTTVMEVNKTAGTRDQITAGATGITYGGTLAITNLAGAPFAAGDSFKLFSAAAYSGSFANIAPATPGSGLAWSSLSNGTIQVIAAVSTPPTISGITVSGGNVIITGTNNTGSAGTYHILTSTNLIQPLTNWLVWSSGSFGSGGTLAVTNSVGTNSQQYFILQEP